MYLPLKQTYVGSNPTGPTKFQAMQQISCCALTNVVLISSTLKKENFMNTAQFNSTSIDAIGGGCSDINGGGTRC